MAATVVSMAQAISAGQELVGYEQSGTLAQNELSAIEDGLDIIKFGAPFLVKDKPPVMACSGDHKKVFEDCLAQCEAHQKRAGSMLTVFFITFILPGLTKALQAILANLVTPTPPAAS